MDHPACKTCPYWDDDGDGKAGECKRFPPVLIPSDELYRHWQEVAEGLFTGTQPDTDPGDWCGEHPDFRAYIRSLKFSQDASSED